MAYLISNIPHFKCWVRKEFTANHEKYHGEYLSALAIAVNTIPDRSLSFQVVFTGCEIDNQEDCDRTEWCEWSENAGCVEGEWDDEDDWDEDGNEIDIYKIQKYIEKNEIQAIEINK